MAHWSKTKPFDRLIFGTIETSILSIDSFRALDTTRIFVATNDHTYLKENVYINSFDQKYVLNRTAGGEMPNGLIDAIKHRRTRNLAIEHKRTRNLAIKKPYPLLNFFRKLLKKM